MPRFWTAYPLRSKEVHKLLPPFVVERGKGRTVLFVHGQPGLGADWDLVADRLVDDHRVITLDRHGYGSSGRETIGMEATACVLADILQERKAGPTVVTGHSYGGGPAILLAARRPDLVSGLVLVASIGTVEAMTAFDRILGLPVVGEALSAAGFFTLGRMSSLIRRKPEVLPKGAAQWVVSSLPDEEYEAIASANARRSWRSFVAEQRYMLGEIETVAGALRELAVPTIVLTGTRDVVVTPVASARLASAIGGAELVVLAGQGHFIPRCAPSAVVKAVRRVGERRQSHPNS